MSSALLSSCLRLWWLRQTPTSSVSEAKRGKQRPASANQHQHVQQTTPASACAANQHQQTTTSISMSSKQRPASANQHQQTTTSISEAAFPCTMRGAVPFHSLSGVGLLTIFTTGSELFLAFSRLPDEGGGHIHFCLYV